MIADKQSIEGFVLAGGASSRMGLDKAFLKLGDRTIVEMAISALRAISEKVSVVGARDVEPLGSDIEILDDVLPRYWTHGKASIIGVYTALRKARAEWAAILACDLPFVDGRFMELLRRRISSDLDAVIPVQPDNRLQPLCALYRSKSCLKAVESMFRERELRLHNIAVRVRTQSLLQVEYKDLPGSENYFLNINSPDDYKVAADIFSKG
jgi:molybdopterin-guanine dinucleotide biosynthesis protein A